MPEDLERLIDQLGWPDLQGLNLHLHVHFAAGVPPGPDGTAQILAAIEEARKAMTVEMDDLAAAVTEMNTAVGATATELTGLATKIEAALSASNMPAIEAAATSIHTAAKALNDAVAATEAAINPTPVAA
jgi:predicted oxidoreductase